LTMTALAPFLTAISCSSNRRSTSSVILHR
jgi:hypothetical protein